MEANGRRRLYTILVVLCCAAAAALLLPPTFRGQEHRLNVGGRQVVRVWHPWGGPMGPAFDDLIADFEASHPGIQIEPVYISNDLSTNQKFFTAVAAHTPPQVTFVDGPQVAEWAERGALESLDDRLQAAGVVADDFWPPCWRQNHYREHVWALTYCADPNFGFVWNKADFRSVHLDPDKPPETIAQLDAYCDKLTVVENGQMQRIGIIPWGIYGSANSIFTWGWAFGGRFYDDETKRITANDPRIVAALEWMCSYAEKYDVTHIAGLQSSFGTAEQNPFYIGKLSMTCMHIGGIEDIKRYAPKLDYGIGYLPYPPGGELHSSWVGGWCVAIPKGAQNADAAWEFIRWVCADPVGTDRMGVHTGLFPGYRHSPYFRRVAGRKPYDMYLKILEECKHQRPVMPVQAYYMGALQRAVDSAIYGEKTPREVLDQATKETQRELDMVLAGG
jgi:multiple sugar transport system substrate-binding protein